MPPRDQAVGQSQRRAPLVFSSRHLTAVALVIHPEQMQNAMQHQDFDLAADRMPILGGLAFGMLERNRDIAEGTERLPGRKRQYVGSVVSLPKIAVQTPQLRLQTFGKRERLPPRKGPRKARRGRMK